MIEERATVVEVGTEFVIVQTLRKTSCNSCAANKACGTAVLSKAVGQKHSFVSISKTETAEPILSVGDEVIIGINENMLFSGSMLAYLVPLAGLMCFALIANWIGAVLMWKGELHIVLSALLGLVSGLYGSRWYILKGHQRADFEPVLLSKPSQAKPV